MEKFYNEYGKFIIHFENICFKMNYCIRQICVEGNLFGIQDKRIEILLQGLTAQPILTKFKSLFLTTEYSNDSELSKLVDTFHSNFLKVIEYRNFIAHGTFFHGDPHGNIDKFQIRNPKLNKKGFYDNTNIIDIKSFEKFNKEVMKLEKFIDYLCLYINNTRDDSKGKIYNVMKSSMNNLSVKLDIDNKSLQW